MDKLVQGFYTGERALYNISHTELEGCTFDDGESPLKECHDLKLNHCIFKWKYPLWYGHDFECNHCSLLDTARSGIWYTYNLVMNDCFIQAPKTFRRAHDITLNNCTMPNALESFWNCQNITLNHVEAKGDYFLMNVENCKIDNFFLDGNYAFDGGKNIEIRNAKLLSKDSFWNCENVVVYDSYIVGEYLGWNSKNITFINCVIDSTQGMCYMDNIKMVNCKLLNTDLCFELCSNIDATITSKIDSVKNPISGRIVAQEIGELILDEKIIDPSKTEIKVEK